MPRFAPVISAFFFLSVIFDLQRLAIPESFTIETVEWQSILRLVENPIHSSLAPEVLIRCREVGLESSDKDLVVKFGLQLPQY